MNVVLYHSPVVVSHKFNVHARGRMLVVFIRLRENIKITQTLLVLTPIYNLDTKGVGLSL